MTQRKVSKVVKALCEKGMEVDDNHHKMLRKRIDGVTTVVTRVSRSHDEISAQTGRLMARQCLLQLREFWALVDCTLSESEWDDLIASRTRDGRNPFLGH